MTARPPDRVTTIKHCSDVPPVGGDCEGNRTGAQLHCSQVPSDHHGVQMK